MARLPQTLIMHQRRVPLLLSSRKMPPHCGLAHCRTRVRRGRVDKRLTLRAGHAAVYCEHVLSGFSGALPIGTHPMLKFPEDAGPGCISSSGFTHEAAEQLAALAAELTAVHQRYHGLVHGNLRLNAGGIALVDAAGHGQVCVWPLTLGSHSFLLIVAGVPLLHGRAFADAIWGLAHRYATPA